MLFLALSSLQGRPMQQAAEDLLRVASAAGVVCGLQLTPGCAPTEGFREWLVEHGVTTTTHHGFSWTALRRTVWDDDGRLRTTDDSVHPPKTTSAGGAQFWKYAERFAEHGATAFETMYPGYVLGTGADLERAMEAHLPLAVDVSHLNMQQAAGVVTAQTLTRLFEHYDRVVEVHVSANDGRADQHRLIADSTYGLGWVRERLHEGTPVVIESYLHRVEHGQRVEQLQRVAGNTTREQTRRSA